MLPVAERPFAHSKTRRIKPQSGLGSPREPALTLGSLAMSIVHDLRNPLSAIYTASELLCRESLSDQQVRRLALNMYNASVRIRDMLQAYSESWRNADHRPGPANLRNLISHSVGRISAIAEAQSVRVMEEVPEDLEVNVDQSRIGSVLANLLVNALEAMPGGGWIHISAAAEENTVIVRVRDAGPGIAPEIRDRLFQPFVTAGKSNGWGFGLASARQFVAEHDGEIWVESGAGGGACFAFTLPLLSD